MTRNRVKRKSVETLVLFRNKHTCCICRDYKSYQDPIVHHIDGNPMHTVESNLAVLCPTHASMADAGLRKGKLGAGRKLTFQEVIMNKKNWEDRVLAELRVEKRTLSKQNKKELERLYEFEIHKIKNQILATNDTKDNKSKYEFLTQLSIEEAISGIPLRKIVLRAFSDIAVQTAGEKRQTFQLLKALPDLFLHLVGPEEVPIHSDDRRYLIRALDILDTLGSYGASISDDREVLEKVCKSLSEFVDIAVWYKFKEFLKKAVIITKKIKKECNDYSHHSIARAKREIKLRTRITENYLSIFQKQLGQI